MAMQRGLGVLEREHSDIESLFDEVSDPGVNRPKVLQDIMKRLATHIAVEQAVFFPVVTERHLCADGTAEALKGEYEEMERLLILIERRKVNSPDIPSLVTELKDVFSAHTERFAGEIRPAALAEMSPEDLAELDQKMESADEVILSHAHPHMLSLGPISRFTTRLASKFDSLRDRTVNNRTMAHGSRYEDQGQ